MPKRSPFSFSLTLQERRTLEAITRKYTSAYRDVIRARIALLAAEGMENKQIGSGRQGRNPAGESPVMSIPRFGHVAIPRFMSGNRMFIAWCKRPGRLGDSEPQQWVQPGGLASVGA